MYSVKHFNQKNFKFQPSINKTSTKIIEKVKHYFILVLYTYLSLIFFPV